MTAVPRAELYSSRLVLRTVRDGQPYLANLLRGTAVPLYPDVAAIFNALWDRADRRSFDERLAQAPPATNPKFRQFLLEQLVETGLLVEAAADEAAEWIARQDGELAALPQVDQVELTNACPFTCPFCPRGLQRMTRPVGHLDLGLLSELVDQVKGQRQYKPFGLHHFGDPLLHPRAAEAVRIVRQAGLEPELSVNPILLTPEISQSLLEAGVGVLIVSMDGLDTPTLQAMRGRAAGTIEQVEKNIEALIELASRRERPPTVMISMVATVLNRPHWRELFRRYLRPGRSWLTPVVRLLDDFGDPAVAPLAVERLRLPCAAPFHAVCVLWDGTAVVCCHDHDGAIALGNLREQSLAEIWHGAPAQRFRERWKRFQFEPVEPCARCRWRIDHFTGEATVANTDAWTPALWPERLAGSAVN